MAARTDGVAGLLQRRRGALLVAAAIAAAAVVAALVGHPPDPRPLAGALAGVSWSWLSVAFAANAASILLRAEAWRVLLGHDPATRPTRVATLSAYSVGLLGNTLLPARAGDLARAVVIRRRVQGEGWGAVAGSILAQRCLDVMAFVVLVAVVVATGQVPGWLLTGTVAVAVAGLTLVAAVAVLSRRLRDGVLGGRVRWLGVLIADGLHAFRSPRLAVHAGALQAAGWVAQLMVIDLTLRAFSQPVPLVASALVLMLLNGVLAFPLWPGGVGAYQAVVALALAPYGIASATGFSLGLGVQAVESLVGIAFGLCFAAHEGLSLAALRRSGGRAAPAAGSGPGAAAHGAGAQDPPAG